MQSSNPLALMRFSIFPSVSIDWAISVALRAISALMSGSTAASAIIVLRVSTDSSRLRWRVTLASAK